MEWNIKKNFLCASYILFRSYFPYSVQIYVKRHSCIFYGLRLYNRIHYSMKNTKSRRRKRLSLSDIEPQIQTLAITKIGSSHCPDYRMVYMVEGSQDCNIK